MNISKVYFLVWAIIPVSYRSWLMHSHWDIHIFISQNESMDIPIYQTSRIWKNGNKFLIKFHLDCTYMVLIKSQDISFIDAESCLTFFDYFEHQHTYHWLRVLNKSCLNMFCLLLFVIWNSFKLELNTIVYNRV